MNGKLTKKSVREAIREARAEMKDQRDNYARGWRAALSLVDTLIFAAEEEKS